MAYLNEFPQWESSGRNLDWLLEQYSTFNARIQQILDEFNASVQKMEGDIADLESEYTRLLDNFETRILGEVATISDAIEQISNNVAEYVGEHMEEWQLDAMTGDNNDIIIGEYDPTTPITDGGNLNEIIINNTKYNIREFSLPLMRFIPLEFSDGDLQALSGAKQLADITSTNNLYAYFQKAEEEFGLDGNSCIDYIFPSITYPSNWGASYMLPIANNQIVLSGVRVQKSTNSYKLQVSFAVGNYTEVTSSIYIDVLPILPYLG